jgi:hypothetical protein
MVCPLEDGRGRQMRSLSLAGPGVLVLLLTGCVPMAARPGGPRDGQLAVKIEGADAAGRPMNLSDQRGKVVLLSFWHGG